MIGAFLFTFLPTLFFYLLVMKANFLKSQILKISLSWFVGQYLGTLIIFILSNILVLFTTSVLTKASFLFLIALTIGLLFLKTDLIKLCRNLKLTGIHLPKIAIIAFCFICSYLIFSPHLSFTENKIYTSPVYWDFNIPFPIIQNFVYGDNFPTQNESFSGIPLTYHYFFELLMAIYSTLGLGLVGTINITSTLSFFFLLLSIVGLAEEFLHSASMGFTAILLTLTSSSLRFINYFTNSINQSPFETIKNIFTNNSHPFFFSFVEGNPFGYNGTMFNIFYFVAERQLIFAVLFLTCSLAVFYARKHLSNKLCLLVGLLMGLFFQWHLFITLSVGLAILFLLVFSDHKNKILYLLIGFGITFVFNYLYFKALIKPQWFYPDINNYPKLSFDFPTMQPVYSFSLVNAAGYYIYAYGAKIIFGILGLWLIAKKNKQIFFLFLAIILPTFILANTIQLSPLSVYDNHKWIKALNVFLDIATSVSLVYLFTRKHLILKTISLTGFLFLTLSGFIELMPFFNSKPTNFYAYYPSKFTAQIRNNTYPKASFLSSGSKELHLSGRKLFLGSSDDEPGALSIVNAYRLNKTLREEITKNIYETTDLAYFCQTALANFIDYVEFNKNTKKLPIFRKLQGLSGINTHNENGEPITFINIKQGCRQ